MAGKHQNVTGTLGANPAVNSPMLLSRPNFPGSQVDRAYAEGRLSYKTGGVIGNNPYASGSNRYTAWFNGFFNGAQATAALQTGQA